MAEDHVLSGAMKIWADIRGELQEKDTEEGEIAEAAPVPPEELRKVAKWLQQTVTKFGASAAVAEGPKDPALVPIAKEVVNAFTAAAGTLLSLRRGAGRIMREELRDVGGGLAEALDQLGLAVGLPDMPIAAGKALDRTKHLERISVHNRSASRRRILMSLAQVRDAHRELNEVLRDKTADAEEEEEDTDLDLGDPFDAEELEPHERRLVESINVAASALEDALKQASQACMPATDSTSAPTPVAVLEVVALNAASAAGAVDGLVTHAVGGLDSPNFLASLAQLRKATSAFGEVGGAAEIAAALDGIQVAYDAVPEDEK